MMNDDNNSNNNNDFWTAWQLLDPLLPTGGFAHSNGLEAATQFGFIDNGTGTGIDVLTFVLDIARNACSTLAPFVLAARNRFDSYSLKEKKMTYRRGQKKTQFFTPCSLVTHQPCERLYSRVLRSVEQLSPRFQETLREFRKG